MATLIDVTQLEGQARDDALAPAARALRAGELVALPTETVYGLGAHALDPRAVAGIFAAKGRPANNPLIVHVHDASRARALTTSWDARADALAAAFWPGPLTLVLPRAPEVPDAVTAGLGTVGLRVPAHPVARALLRLADVPVAAPSANLYTRVSPTRAEHVMAGLGDRIAYVVDGGPTDVGVESTVLSLATPAPTILRPGMITLDAIARVLPNVVHRAPGELADGEAAASPGLARKHYSPAAQVVLAAPGEAMALARADARPAAVLVRGGVESLDASPRVLSLPDDPGAYARGLYDALHRADDLGIELLVVARPPDTEAWRAIVDRLVRSTA